MTKHEWELKVIREHIVKLLQKARKRKDECVMYNNTMSHQYWTGQENALEYLEWCLRDVLSVEVAS